MAALSPLGDDAQAKQDSVEVVRPGPPPPSPPASEQLEIEEVMASVWRAPLPRPEDLRLYSEIDASIPERIMHLLEQSAEMQALEQVQRHKIELKQQDHEHRIESKQQTNIENVAWRAQWGIILIVLGFLGVATYQVYEGMQPWSAIGAVLTPVLSALWGIFKRNGDGEK